MTEEITRTEETTEKPAGGSVQVEQDEDGNQSAKVEERTEVTKTETTEVREEEK